MYSNARLIIKRYYKFYKQDEISRAGKAAQMFELEIEHISGKEVREK